MDEKKPLPRPHFWEEMSLDEVRAFLAHTPGVVIPFGVMEPHGRHLPVGTDNLCAIGFAEGLAAATGLLLAPSLPYAPLAEIVNHPGGLGISRGTYGAFVRELLEQFIHNGVRFLVLANGHGPIRKPLMEAMREVLTRHQVQFVLVEWWVLAEAPLQRVMGTSDIGHGGLGEVAAMQRYRPELVHLERATEDSFYVHVPGTLMVPYQRTAVVADPQAVLKADPSKLAEVMAATEADAIAVVQEALTRFRAEPPS